MCTAFCQHSFFGRNLDLQRVYGEEVTVTPRRFPLEFRRQPKLDVHYAMIGAARVQEGIPLYFEAVNEHGLAMAGLSFERDCAYTPPETEGALAPFEVIPFVLAQCADVKEAVQLLGDRTVAALPFDESLPVTPLHWFLCDRTSAVAVEPLEMGLAVCDDPVGVLSNSPPLSYQLTHLSEFASLQAAEPSSLFDGAVSPRHRGYGLKGLPGDFTSSSRFVKAAVLRALTPPPEDEAIGVADAFHLLESVAYPRGAMLASDGTFAVTQYSCVCSLENGTYYYKTYRNPSVRAVPFSSKDEATLMRCPMYK
ncbi:MAG: linear amide C-N hydrolase [Clostridia bacterium]|nr:linear amide C-N hydrolase [Clostridia bacterium]